MNLGALRERLRSRTIRIVLVLVLVLVAGGVALTISSADPTVTTRSQFVAGTPEGSTAVKIDTTLYLPETTPAPAVLLTQGFSGDKRDLDSEARSLAQRGFVVLAYSARGFGQSGGMIHFASPDYEIKDASLLVSYLQKQKQVKPEQIAATGSSYGGGMSLLLAAADSRVKAVSADITWNNLLHAFFPNNGGDEPGPFKKLWLGQLFANGFGPRGGGASLTGDAPAAKLSGSVSCGRFAADVCAAYQASASAGTPNQAMLDLMTAASPATVLSKMKAPTLLTQGEQDSLFPLSEADANARAIAATGTPVSVLWRGGGHDAGGAVTDQVTGATADWFDKVFSGAALSTKQPFTFTVRDGVVSAATGDASQTVLRAPAYPGIAGEVQTRSTVDVTGAPQQVASPAGGVPAVITSIPGLAGISQRFDRALTLLPSSPGQTASFRSEKLTKGLRIIGSPTVTVSITANSTSDVTLFAGLRDVGTDGTDTLPSQLVAPIRITGLTPGEPRVVTVKLPSVVRNVLAGHRLVLTFSASDFGYQNPADARRYTISLANNRTFITVPTASGATISAGNPIAWLITGLVVAALVALLVTAVIVRRKLVLKPDPALADVPVSIAGLVKEYAGGYRAVDDISFRVERGQVVGLLGPNGAGKTTALRVLVGLITPTEGQVHVFGQPVVPGAPVLARIGAFIEGPGFLPHLTGRENLRLYWAATGRPIEEAEFDVALDIAGLGGSVDRRVKSYSHGMKQRLGIAQAMLGLPELLVLDEPTNGLDPPQIAEMREVLQQYAETGRTVVVSSHLLSEVEQTCTDVVVMHRGRVVAAGSVTEIAGAGGTQLAVPDPAEATRVLAAAGIGAQQVPARRALEDVFLGLIGDDE